MAFRDSPESTLAGSPPATDKTALSEATRPQATRAATILIADDDPVNRRLLRAILEKEGHLLFEATGGDEAIAIASQLEPDIVLLDVMMPDKDGYEVCAEIKANSHSARIPIIFISALSEANERVKGLELGAIDYITKPFGTSEVLARVRNQLKIQQLTRDLMDVNRDLMEKQRALEEDLKAAAAIQESLLSTQDHQVDGVRIASRFRPCEAVGGDIFSVSQLGKGHLAVSMIDVSGHGVPATMLSVSLARTLSPEAGNIIKPGSPPTPPSVVMRTLDEKYPIERFDKHFTICYLLFDCTTGRVRYTRAGHPMPVIQRADGSFQVLDAGGTVIGLGSDLPFEEREAQLSLGDRIFLYSDGLVELESPDGAPYGEERFLHELRACRGATLDDACDRILESLRVFADGRPAKDDITLLALEYECASGARGAGKDPDRSH